MAVHENDQLPQISKAKEEYYLYAGRIENIKGIDVLLEAWRMMGKQAPQLKLCGNGPKEQYVKDYIESKGIENISVLGYQRHEQVMHLIKKCKAVIYPTQVYETFGMVIIESFSVGTPVICSDFGNAGNMVNDGIDGFKFDKNSSEDLINAVIKFEKYRKKIDLYINARNKYLNMFSENGNYEMIIDIYGRCKK